MIERNKIKEERLVSKQEIQLDNNIADFSLRPKNLHDYIGQIDLKRNLEIFMKAAKFRNEAIEHILLYGPPGLGKTTLSHVIANEMGVNIRVTSGPAIEKQGDLASIITNLQENDILFIDEIHRLKPVIEEVLYSAMEDFCLDLIIGKGPSAQTMRLTLPPFTLIGATTKLSMLSSPLRDRFGSIFKLDFYTHKEITDIIKRSAGILKIGISDSGAEKIAFTSRQTPRIANRLLRRVRDFGCIYNRSQIDENLVEEALQSLGIDDLGLDNKDRSLLKVMIEKFDGRAVGLNTLAAALNEEKATIEEVYEPYLLQLGLLDRTVKGRIATHRAYRHLGVAFESNI